MESREPEVLRCREKKKEVHLQVADAPGDATVRRRRTTPLQPVVNNYAAAFSAQAKVERIQNHKLNLLRAFELIEKQRPESVKATKSMPKLRTLHRTTSMHTAAPVFDLSELMAYADISPPKPTTERLRTSSRKVVGALAKLDRPQSATALTPPKAARCKRPQSATDRVQRQVESQVQRVLNRYYAKFQPHLPVVKTWAVPLSDHRAPTPCDEGNSSGLPHFHLNFRGLPLRNGGIPGFNVRTTPSTFALRTFVPRMLVSVDLAGTQLSDAGCYAVATQLIHEPSITSLDVRSNALTLDGIHVLLDAVQCRAMYHALNHRLAPVTTLLLANAGVDMDKVQSLVAAANLSVVVVAPDDVDCAALGVEHLLRDQTQKDGIGTSVAVPNETPVPPPALRLQRLPSYHAVAEPTAATEYIRATKLLPTQVLCTPLTETRQPRRVTDLTSSVTHPHGPPSASSDERPEENVTSEKSTRKVRLGTYLDHLEASVHQLCTASPKHHLARADVDAAPALAHQVAFSAAHTALYRLYRQPPVSVPTIPRLDLGVQTSSHPSAAPWRPEHMTVVGSVAQQVAAASLQWALFSPAPS
ncbi:hypothetical protein SPRG_06893 [Saprolegnia parasitica CBS 223.65]|uniref:Uncharacterized protein n=1 Tax=Saprolegnia parasitica (strain CBS 223.65) TaxID=695850 RepID=A0A067CAV7_SAPPC|nr:hypothetical protein SPRG_06893 [Saprolegnia parasitica CBS 223.65]KDO27623.1 hypothetical protein SPRG_06893 [Saprolegnia parasitica CBS 223.65]|eukprot:XP_012201745.1 hypothetical protein SPRG_06893 [Saprolegnia parasitica CBS 223.65]